MALSVMSAFARRNVDPWEEAAETVSAAEGRRDPGVVRDHARSCRPARIAPARDR